MKKMFNREVFNNKVNNFSKVIFTNLNVSKVICHHLIDEKHSHTHRMVVGIIIMIGGVGISKISTTITVVHFIFDGLGYAIHGIGLIPFVEALSKREEDKNKDKEV